uniref:ABC transporter permease n=1 Tax=Staphylothermus marinus TaxID=2280 RepID=A0A7C4JL10_STAMA
MREEIRAVLLVAYRDLARFWRYRYWLFGQIVMNIADIAIFGLIFRGIVNRELIPDYLKFITPGVLSLSIFISSFSIGREVGMELRREVTHYFLSLPIKRGGFVTGRLLGGLARGFIYQTGFLILALILLNPPSLMGWILIISTSIMLALIMSSLSISLTTITRDFNLQATIRSLVYNVLFFVSNIFYPKRVVEARLGSASFIVDYSPLTMATNIYRWSFKYDLSINPMISFLGLAIWVIVILPLAYKLYIRNLV